MPFMLRQVHLIPWRAIPKRSDLTKMSVVKSRCVPTPVDHSMRQAPNLILTPHRAFYSRESVIELQTKAAEEVARGLKGEPSRSPVNPEVLTGFGLT